MMDHNDFDFDDDFILPVIEFFSQINLNVEDAKTIGVHGLSFSDDYFFPPPKIVDYEKTMIKSSIIWEIIEDRKK
jgi:hypothetical protein